MHGTAARCFGFDLAASEKSRKLEAWKWSKKLIRIICGGGRERDGGWFQGEGEAFQKQNRKHVLFGIFWPTQ